ncbi:MAG: hypothetical protein ASARMPRED_005340 [Alectoria sarmentosa]|nr:MAG: hypothetical protein ASARMPRED_005340 [Alectoria sarmentosa]
MRVPNEQVAAHDRDPTESETIAASHQRNTMQDSRRPRVRDITDETKPLPPTVCIEDVSDDIATPRDENQDSLGEQFANLEISPPVLPRSPRPLLSPDYPLQSVEAAERTTIPGPITVRDLINATPRPSPSPEPHTQPALRAYGDLVRARSETIDEPNSPAAGEEPDTENEPICTNQALTGEIFINLCHCEGSARPGTQLQKTKQRAEALNKVDNPGSRTIGIVGDCAASKGKSSLINSLLRLPNLAHKGDHGSAVTSFVTEYRKRTPNRTDNTLEVEFANPEEINEQIHELLFSFREVYRKGLEEATADDVYQGIEKRSEIALNTLQSIFSNRPETDAEYPKGTDGHTFEQIESGLRSLAGDLGSPEGSIYGKWTYRCHCERMPRKSCAFNGKRPLASDEHRSVRRILPQAPEAQSQLTDLAITCSIYLDAQVLRTGIILADQPGDRDINLPRVKKAEEYLFHCDELFVVANINRVVTTETVKEILRKKLGPYMTISESVCLICTHADEIDIPKYEKNRNWASTANSTEAKAAKRAVHRFRARGGSAELRERLVTKYIPAPPDKYEGIADTQNIKGIQAARPSTSSVIGNKDYDMEGVHFWDLETHEMAIQGSDIPEIRKHCHSIVARAQFRTSNHFLEVEVPDLVQSLEIFESDLLERVDIYSDSVDKQPKTQILGFWKRQERAFNQQAREASREWEGWHPTSDKAWANQNGTHETRAQGFRRWNDDLLQHIYQDTENRWAELLLRLDEQSDSIQNAVKDELDNLGRLMRACCQTPQALLTLLKLKKREIIYLLQEKLAILRRDLKYVHIFPSQWNYFQLIYGTIEYNASGDHVTSMIVTTMLPTCRGCARESGPGTEARMHGIMASRMGRQDIVRYNHDYVTTESNRAIEARVDNISNHLTEMCAEIGRQVETVIGEEAQEAFRSHPEDLRRVEATIATARDDLLSLRLQATTARTLARSWDWIE